MGYPSPQHFSKKQGILYLITALQEFNDEAMAINLETKQGYQVRGSLVGAIVVWNIYYLHPVGKWCLPSTFGWAWLCGFGFPSLQRDKCLHSVELGQGWWGGNSHNWQAGYPINSARHLVHNCCEFPYWIWHMSEKLALLRKPFLTTAQCSPYWLMQWGGRNW